MSIVDEIWKDVVGFEGFYQVSNLGRVRSVDRVVFHPVYGDMRRKSRVLKSSLSTCGYLSLILCRDGVNFSKTVHSLVALAFIGDRLDGYQINHKDGDRFNNSLENLEYCTRLDNMRHAFAYGLMNTPKGEKQRSAKLKASDIPVIRQRLSEGHFQTAIARDYGVGQAVISSIKLGKTWSHVK
jgi:hypothetical protein